eukprot:6190674-Pleurochrysis_carterae.AAC.3
MLLARRVAAGRGRERRKPWRSNHGCRGPRPADRLAQHPSRQTAWRGNRKKRRGCSYCARAESANAAWGVQGLLGPGHRAGGGTGRRFGMAVPPTPLANAQGGHKAYARPPCLWCAPACVEIVLVLYGLCRAAEKHSRRYNEHNSEPEDRGTRLSLLRDSHGEADVARDSVPRAQECNDAIRANRCEDDVISIHDGCVHARIVHA